LYSIASVLHGKDIPLWLRHHSLISRNSIYHKKVRMAIGQERLWQMLHYRIDPTEREYRNHKTNLYVIIDSQHEQFKTLLNIFKAKELYLDWRSLASYYVPQLTGWFRTLHNLPYVRHKTWAIQTCSALKNKENNYAAVTD
jgi:hypothetical protein